MSRPKSIKEALPGMWRIGAYFWPEVRKHRTLVAGSLVALFAEIGFRLLEPWPLKVIFDRLIHVKQRYEFLPPSLSNMDNAHILIVAAIAVVVFAGGRAIASFQSTIGFAKLGNRVLTKVRNRLYRHVQYLSLSFHTKARTGDLVVRVMSDVGMLQDVAVTALLPTLAKVLIVTGMFSLMLWLNWRLALIAVSLWPLFLLRSLKLTREIREVAQKQRQREGAMAATAAESLGAMRTVQALSLEGTFADAFSRESERTLKQDVKGKRLAAALGRWVNFLIAISTALVLWYGGHLVLKGEITGGDLLVFLAYLRYAYSPVQDFAKYTGRMAKATAAGDRVIELLECVPEVRDRDDAIKAPTFKGRITFDHVNFGYEKDARHLEDVQLEITPGQHVAIVGPSGAGKSTLVSLLLRLYDATGGRVMVDGRDVRDYTLDSLRGQISVVLQDNLLFGGTIRDNIIHGAPTASQEQVEAAAKLANAHEFILGLPNGYNTQVGERGVMLSHGQRQRIAVARAAIRQAPILILDEPTTGLDAASEAAVITALEQLYITRTTLLITHDLSQAGSADFIVYIEAGKILEQGNHVELMRLNGRYAEAYRVQTGSVMEEFVANGKRS
jgi:ATP-binding cassette, subfamily B, bacterial